MLGVVAEQAVSNAEPTARTTSFRAVRLLRVEELLGNARSGLGTFQGRGMAGLIFLNRMRGAKYLGGTSAAPPRRRLGKFADRSEPGEQRFHLLDFSLLCLHNGFGQFQCFRILAVVDLVLGHAHRTLMVGSHGFKEHA